MDNQRFKKGTRVRAIAGPDKGIEFTVAYAMIEDRGFVYFSENHPPNKHPKYKGSTNRWTHEDCLMEVKWEVNIVPGAVNQVLTEILGPANEKDK